MFRALSIALAFCLAAAGAGAAPISVMIVGDFHMSNPGRDIHNMRADDMLAPKRQAEIAAVTSALLRFRPTLVAIEWPADVATQRYADYLKGTLAPSRNESVQLGFRLAKEAALSQIHGIDVDGDFPYDAVEAYAKTHGQQQILDSANEEVQKMVDTIDRTLATGTVSQTLRYLNDPKNVEHGNDFYRLMLKIGGGAQQPGADLLTAWYKRNFYICANLAQLARPGDRAVVFYGSGHAILLRQCVRETPGFRLVDANDYLPK
ncbi:MAG TPA: DUF5694 domain-containing protein [Rhizomicrobium sp.]|jgi:hypothetical protein|nr:DUF5694 domain-containing protein [Rhizomicrobium sp.]